MSKTAKRQSLKAKRDRRLLGKWRSDRRRTFANYTPPKGLDAEAQLRFERLFGHLTLHFKPATFVSDYRGCRTVGKYEMVASDSESVVIRFTDIFNEPRVSQLHFTDHGFWVWLSIADMREFFLRVG